VLVDDIGGVVVLFATSAPTAGSSATVELLSGDGSTGSMLPWASSSPVPTRPGSPGHGDLEPNPASIPVPDQFRSDPPIGVPLRTPGIPIRRLGKRRSPLSCAFAAARRDCPLRNEGNSRSFLGKGRVEP